MDPSFSLGKRKDDKLIMQVRRTLPSSCGKQEGGGEEEKRRKKKSVHTYRCCTSILSKTQDEGSIKRPPVTGPTIEEARTRPNLNCR